MNKLFLFDIDNTLVTTRRYDKRFERAIRKVHGAETSLPTDSLGHTDQLMLAMMLGAAGLGAERIQASMPQLLQELDLAHADGFDATNITLLPGVQSLLDALKARGHTLGLITGNAASIAQRKLGAVGIGGYFAVGGFGDDPHTTRADLVTIAIERADFQDRLDDVYVVGDTRHDIAAAHQAGVRNSIGVSNGFRDTSELSEARFVFETLGEVRAALDTVLA